MANRAILVLLARLEYESAIFVCVWHDGDDGNYAMTWDVSDYMLHLIIGAKTK